jgi:hypothetical protein
MKVPAQLGRERVLVMVDLQMTPQTRFFGCFSRMAMETGNRAPPGYKAQ